MIRVLGHRQIAHQTRDTTKIPGVLYPYLQADTSFDTLWLAIVLLITIFPTEQSTLAHDATRYL